MSITPTDSTELDRAGMPLGTPAQTGAAALNKAASRPRPTAESQTDQPSTTDKLIDTMVTKMAGEIARPEAPPPPPPQFSVSQRIGMQILAAADPEFYKSAIIPMLQGQQTTMENYRQRVDGMRGDKDRAMMNLIGLAQARDAQKDRAANMVENARLREDELGRREREDAAQDEQKLMLSAASAAAATGIHQSLPFTMNQARSLANALARSDSAFEQAQAKAIVEEVTGLMAQSTAIQDGISKGGMPNPALVGQLMASRNALQARIDQMGTSGAMMEARAKAKTEQGTRLRMIPAGVIENTKKLSAQVARVGNLLKQLPQIGKFGGLLGTELARHPNLAKDASRMGMVFNASQFSWLQEYSDVIGKIRPERMGLAQTFIEMQKQAMNMPDPGMDSELVGTALEHLAEAAVRDMSGYVDALQATGKDESGVRAMLSEMYNSLPDTIRARFLVPPGMPLGTQFAGVVISPSDPSVMGRKLIMPDGSVKFYRERNRATAESVQQYYEALGGGQDGN